MRMTRVVGALLLVAGLVAIAPHAAGAANPAPTINATGGVSPTTATNDNTAQLTITGTGFAAGAVATLERSTTVFTATTTTVNSATSITAVFDITNQAPAFWIVRVKNSDGQSGAYGNGTTTGFQIVASGTPTISTISPPSAPAGSDANITITGNNIFKGVSVTFIDTDDVNNQDIPPNNITTDSLNWDSKTQFHFVAHIPSMATANQSVRISNTDGASDTKPSGFFKVDAAINGPTITSIGPNVGANTGVTPQTTICGTNFGSAGTYAGKIQLEKTGQDPIPSTSDSTLTVTTPPQSFNDCNPTQANPQPSEIKGAKFDLTLAAPGPWTVRATNSDHGTGTLANGFTIAGSQPVVSSIAPATAKQGDGDTNVTITGTHFAKGDTVSLGNNGNGGIQISSINTSGVPTTITANFKVTSTATPGAHDVIVTHTDGQSGSLVGGFQVSTTNPHAFDYVAYDPNFLGGVSVAGGNLVPGGSGDEVVTGAGPGGGPNVIVARPNLSGSGATVVASFFAYDGAFAGGVRVAVGEFDGNAADGAELVTAPGPGGGPNVRIWKVASNGTVSQLASFMAYDPGFVGGVNVAAGNVANSGANDQIITGAGSGGGPHVRVFTVPTSGAIAGSSGFFAYNAAFTGGVNVAVGDFGSTLHHLIVTGAGPGGGPDVEVYDGGGSRIGGFFAYDAAFTGGVSVAAGNVSGSSGDEIITGAGPGGGPDVEIWGGSPVANLKKGYYAFGQSSFAGGVRVATADVDGGGNAEIVDGPWTAGPSTIEGIRLSP